MSRKLIAVVFSDLHLHVYNQFNENNRRLHTAFKVMEILWVKGVPVLFSGDMFHEDNHISNKLLNLITIKYNSARPRYPIIGISGNHDMCEMNNYDNISPSLYTSLCRMFPNCFHNIDWGHFILNKETIVFGIPYLTYNSGLHEALDLIRNGRNYKKYPKRILLIHTDLHGAKDTDNRQINSVENIDRNMSKFFKGFDLVFSGHIHKPQRLTPKIIMVGAPMQQRKSDMFGEFGYWEVFDDMTYKFIPLDMPQFKLYDPAIDETDEYHYWIPINKQEEYEEQQLEKRFTNNVSRVKLAQRYCKEKGIKSSQKVNALKDILND